MGSYGAWQQDRADALEEERDGLRREIEVLRGIVQRVNDGWEYVKPDRIGEKGLWIRLRTKPFEEPEMQFEPMSEPEHLAIYGSVVREETP